MSRDPLDLNPGGKKLGIRFARVYSDIFSPPSVYAIFAFILAWSEFPFWKGTLQAVIFGSLTSLAPLIYLIVQIKLGKLDDIHISTSGQRKIPYILGVAGAVTAYVVLRWVGSSPLFLTFIIAVIIGLCVLGIINQRWLISAHSASISAVTAFSWFAFDWTVALVLSPLIISTVLIRYYLKRHSIGELISGTLLGIFVVSGLALLGLFGG
jgi:hypothetical protein